MKRIDYMRDSPEEIAEKERFNLLTKGEREQAALVRAQVALLDNPPSHAEYRRRRNAIENLVVDSTSPIDEVSHRDWRLRRNAERLEEIGTNTAGKTFKQYQKERETDQK